MTEAPPVPKVTEDHVSLALDAWFCSPAHRDVLSPVERAPMRAALEAFVAALARDDAERGA